MQDVESLLAAIVRDLPVFRNMPGKPVITRVGGLSNRTYRIDTAQGSFALRVPQTDSGPFVNRLHEIEATGMASEIGVGADLIHAQENGVMLTRWVEDARPSCPMIYRSDPHAIDRVARAIATLHRSGREFKGQFDLVNVLDIYRARLAFRGQMSWYGPLETTVDAACRGLACSMGDLVPSHCDLVPENCLDTGSRVVLIDWEYAGMNDPAFDLAYLAIEADFAPMQEHRLLASYAGPTVTYGRLQVFKLLVAVLNLLWDAGRNDDPEDRGLSSWARQRLSAAERLIRDDRFGTWLAEIAG